MSTENIAQLENYPVAF